MARGSNPSGVKFFCTPPDRPWCPPRLLYNEYRVFPGAKAAEAWRWPPTPSSTEVKERVQLYLYSACGPLWPVLGWNLPLLYLLPASFRSWQGIDSFGLWIWYSALSLINEYNPARQKFMQSMSVHLLLSHSTRIVPPRPVLLWCALSHLTIGKPTGDLPRINAAAFEVGQLHASSESIRN